MFAYSVLSMPGSLHKLSSFNSSTLSMVGITPTLEVKKLMSTGRKQHIYGHTASKV